MLICCRGYVIVDSNKSRLCTMVPLIGWLTLLILTLLTLMSYRCSGLMPQWSEAALFRWRKLGCNWVPTPACLLPFFFLSSFFYPLAFYCLFSLLTPLASRDFCENVFLVLWTKIGSFHHIDKVLWIHEHEPQASESTRKFDNVTADVASVCSFL